jgi:Zn-finger domain-containing protein
MQGKPTKHDRYVLELSDKIKDGYDSLSLHVPIMAKKRSLGEADIIARKGNRCDVYEVKCSHRIVKARKQLKRLKRFLKAQNVRKLYFYCGSSGLLVLV